MKEAQVLARHAPPNLTISTYGRAHREQFAEVAEAVGRHVRSTTGEQRGNVLALSDARKQSCLVEAAGIEPASV